MEMKRPIGILIKKEITNEANTNHNQVNINNIIQYALNNYVLDSFHGLPHWQRVERNGLLLAEREDGVDRFVVRLFAYLHDSCRMNDYEDIEHGIRAANMIEGIRDTLLKELTDTQFMQLKRACELHTTTVKVDDATINCCFDADRLDLGRCGITVDPRGMATQSGKFFAKNWEVFEALCKKEEKSQTYKRTE